MMRAKHRKMICILRSPFLLGTLLDGPYWSRGKCANCYSALQIFPCGLASIGKGIFAAFAQGVHAVCVFRPIRVFQNRLR